MKRRQISNKDLRAIEEEVRSLYGAEGILSGKRRVEAVDTKMGEVIFADGMPWLFRAGEGKVLAPTLHLLLTRQILKEIAIDMPAVRFIANGADVMRPGIVRIADGIITGEAVCVVDEHHGKPLAVGLALFPSAEMRALASGKVIKTVHHVGDELWSLSKKD